MSISRLDWKLACACGFFSNLFLTAVGAQPFLPRKRSVQLSGTSKGTRSTRFNRRNYVQSEPQKHSSKVSQDSGRPHGVVPFVFHGSFSVIGNIKDEPEAVLKYPKWNDELTSNMFEVESKILQHLGSHPRIVRYLGVSDRFGGIKLKREKNGGLQQWLDGHEVIEDAQRLKWCGQAAEALEYIHEKGVIHCDLRPANYLLNDNLDLRLCDFGGSKFGELYGRGLPNAGFYDPSVSDPVSVSGDIFALGSVIYTIMKGHFPHGSRGMMTLEEAEEYNQKATQLLIERHFPTVVDLPVGHIIISCWNAHAPASYFVEEITDLLNRNI